MALALYLSGITAFESLLVAIDILTVGIGILNPIYNTA
jgi:hypothetical protein